MFSIKIFYNVILNYCHSYISGIATFHSSMRSYRNIALRSTNQDAVMQIINSNVNSLFVFFRTHT